MALRSKQFAELQEQAMQVLESDGSLQPSFYEGAKRVVQKTITDSEGMVLENRQVEISYRKPIGKDRFIRLEEDAKDYDIENLQKAGVALKPFTGSFIHVSVDALSNYFENVDLAAPFPEAELPSSVIAANGNDVTEVESKN